MHTYEVQSTMDTDSSYPGSNLRGVASELISPSFLWLKRLTITDKVLTVKFAIRLSCYLQSKIDESRLYKYTSNTISSDQVSKYKHFIATLSKQPKLRILALFFQNKD